MPSTMIETSTLPAGSAVDSLEPAKKFAYHRTLDKLALVIPTLCEAENIGALLDNVRSVLDPLHTPYEILVVDDDSPDGTGAVVEAIALDDPRVRLVVRKGERGLSGAILHGWQRSDATVLGVMDADLQHPPELLPELLLAIKDGRDLVIGSRYTAGGDLGQWNPVRKLLSATAVLGYMAAAAVPTTSQRSHVRVLHGPPAVPAARRISEVRVQAAAGDPGSRPHPVRRGSPVCLWPPLSRCKQGQFQSRLGLWNSSHKALCKQARPALLTNQRTNLPF